MFDTKQDNNFLPPKTTQNSDVDLIEYILVLWKRKLSIIIIIFIILGTSIVVNLIAKETFQASSLVSTGIFKNKPISSFADTQTTMRNQQTINEIKSKSEILKDKKTSEISRLFDIIQNDEKDSKLIHITGKGSSPEKAVEIVQAVTQVLLDHHQILFKEVQEQFDFEVELIKRKKQKTEKEINQTESEIALFDKDIAFYQNEINKRSNASSEAQGRIVESYIGLLAESKKLKQVKLHTLLNLKQTLANYDAEFQTKEFEATYETKPTKVEIQPVLPETKIAPTRKKNVMIAMVIAIFIGILYAFIIDFFSRNKNKFKNQKNNLNQIINNSRN